MKNQDRILALEEQISSAKMELNLLLSDSVSDSSKINAKRLEEIEHEIQYMNRQLVELKASLLITSETISEASQSELDTPIIPVSKNDTNAPTSPFDEPFVRTFKEISKTKGNTPSFDWEAIFGKSLMGIFASILIFVSLIFFGTLLVPLMNDTAKQILMFLMSFSFTGIGLYRLRKNADNKLNISLSGCGMGGIYISLFMSNMYFHQLNDIALYLILIVWCIGICYLSKYQSLVFQCIGQIGTIIATLFGILYCESTGDSTMLLFLTIFLIVTELIYSIYFDRLPYINLLINSWGCLLCAALFLLNEDFLCTTLVSLLDGGNASLYGFCRIILLCLIIFSMMVLVFKHNHERSMYKILGNLTLIFNAFLCFNLLDSVHIAAMIIFALILAGIEVSHKNGHQSFIPTQVILFTIFTIAWFSCDLISSDCFYPALFTSIALGYGIYGKKAEYRIYGFFCFFLFVISSEINPWLYLILSLLLYGLVIGLSVLTKTLTITRRNILYVFSFFTLYHYMVHLYHFLDDINAPEDLDALLILGIYFLYNVFMRFYRKDLVSRRITTAFNGFLMLVLSVFLRSHFYGESSLFTSCLYC